MPHKNEEWGHYKKKGPLQLVHSDLNGPERLIF
jgi:hypothetical protein